MRSAKYRVNSNKIESVSLRKCPYDHRLTNKAYLSAVTMTNISQSFVYKMAAKINCHKYGTKLRNRCHPVYKSERKTQLELVSDSECTMTNGRDSSNSAELSDSVIDCRREQRCVSREHNDFTDISSCRCRSYSISHGKMSCVPRVGLSSILSAGYTIKEIDNCI